MKKYYVTVDCQGQTEVVIQVLARSPSDAEYVAMKAYLADKEIGIVNEDIAKTLVDDGIVMIDEDGGEIDFE